MASSRCEIDREAVKTLAIAIGVRKAARQLGLNEDRVRQWSKRGAWFKTPLQPPRQGDVTTVTTPSNALVSVLQADSEASKIGFSKASRKAAESLATKPATILLDKDTAQAAKHWHGIASGTHGWEEKQVQANVMVNIALLGVDPDSVRVETPDVIELDNTPRTNEPAD